jgi:hypothetical protein
MNQFGQLNQMSNDLWAIPGVLHVRPMTKEARSTCITDPNLYAPRIPLHRDGDASRFGKLHRIADEILEHDIELPGAVCRRGSSPSTFQTKSSADYSCPPEFQP